VDPELPGVDAGEFSAELAAELACFPEAEAEDPPGPLLRVRVRATPGAPRAAPSPGWQVAEVTPEVRVRWRPAPAEAEVLVHRPAPLDEVLLATWARVVTGLRFALAGAGPPLAAFHGASLAGPRGGLLVLGDSGAGKTTLSAHLTHLGSPPRAGYLGDEDALVAPAPGGGHELLALPRRLRLLRAPPGLPGRRFRGFGEEGWLADRPLEGPRRAPLLGVVLLEPSPEAGGAELLELPQDRAAFALLQGLERFPPAGAGTPEGAAAFQAANRAGFELIGALAAGLPARRLRYPQPAGFPAAADLLADLLGAG